MSERCVKKKSLSFVPSRQKLPVRLLHVAHPSAVHVQTPICESQKRNWNAGEESLPLAKDGKIL
jgi:hypothetical protein